jgi:xanthine dehydrogenase small subunit
MIQFILNNKLIKTKVNSGLTLLDFIREDEQIKGTKIGCREGDCGACTVLVGTLLKDKISYQNITSCISPLGNANGKHIVTVEGINLKQNLNTAQQAMFDNYATQCGFCTPGFVVSLTGYALSYSQQNYNDGIEAISGNICRCTGYKSIEKASGLIEKKLLHLNEKDRIKWLIENEFIPDYFKEIPQRLEQLKLTELSKEGIVVANGTDLYVNQADNLSEENINLIIFDKSLKRIDYSNGICTLGANTTVTEMASDLKLNNLFPNLKNILKLVSSQPIRNMGTLGGNFVNASPIGDMSIFFLALNSTLTIKHNNGVKRQIPFKDFHKKYKVFDLQKNELITAISFELPASNTFFNFEKVSKRTHLDIASVNTACLIKLNKNTIKEAHFSIGGTAEIPKYLSKTSAFLINSDLNHENIIKAEKILQTEIDPISDVRGSSNYKRLLARQLFYSHFIELLPEKIKFQSLFT